MDKKKVEKNEKAKKTRTIILVVALVIVLGGIYYYFFLGPSLQFQKMEKEFLKVGQRYVEQNAYLSPKEGNIKDFTLQTFYDADYLEEPFYIPNSKKLCDAKNSFVKVKNNQGTNEYYVYLSCGRFHSTLDHEGPQILLNGQETVTVSLGEKYQEAGVKSVKDNTDGAMKTSDVTVDSSKVDTDTIGEYKVTYTAYDRLNNKTVVTRTVRVVQKLASVVKEEANNNGYYQGERSTPYVLFNAILWRVVGLDNDGNITLVTDSQLANIDYGSTTNVKNSSLVKWLNQYFYPLLSDDAKALIVKESEWCSDPVEANDAIMEVTDCKEKVKLNVGTLTIQEYNRTLDDGFSPIELQYGSSWMLNPSKEKNKGFVQSRFAYGYEHGDASDLNGVRPAVRIQKNVEIIDGDGTYDDPYRLGDYEKDTHHSLLNTRLTGEYVTYSGYDFRIVNKESDGSTHAIMTGVLTFDYENVLTGYQNSSAKNIYNINQKGNLGYNISNNMTEFIQTKYFDSKKVEVPIYKKYAQYGKETDTKTYQTKIAAPNVFDLFSVNSSEIQEQYWYINSSNTKGQKHICGRTGIPYRGNTLELEEAGVKLSVYFNKDVKVTGGDGTKENPYKLSK